MQTCGESRFLVGDLAIVILLEASAREIKYCCDFGIFLCCWLAISSLPKHLESRWWLPTTAVWRTRRPHTPHQERPSISRAVV